MIFEWGEAVLAFAVLAQAVSGLQLLLAAQNARLGEFAAVTHLADDAGVDAFTLVPLQCAVDVFSFTDVDDQHLDGSVFEMECKDNGLSENEQGPDESFKG